MVHAVDHVGQRFGKLVVIELGVRPPGQYDTYRYWRCQCDCSNVHPGVRSDMLRRGTTTSCGCLNGKPLRTRHRRLAEAAD